MAGQPKTREPSGTGRHAAWVATGILLSRIAGLARQRVFAHYFGASAAADAWSAAFRIPNVLQNLFGEGVLSASFIPVYAGLLARGQERDAHRVAGAVFSLLAFSMSVLVLAGVFLTPWLVVLIAPGFTEETRELTVRLVRTLFPGAGLLVLSSWCLGVLNSHRRFLVPYTAPVLWNAAMIVTLLVYGGRVDPFPLAETLAVGSVVGSALQFLVQLPFVFRVARRLRPSLAVAEDAVRTVIRNFVPVFVGRGVVQISAYVDALIATLLPIGSVAVLVYAQILYTLPVSLFGMSVAAAELPAMSGAVGERSEVAAMLRGRLSTGLRRIAFFVIPSAVAFLAFGDILAGALYQTGRFTRVEALWTWGILAGYAVGLLATTFARLYASTFYALRDTRTPLRYALVRVGLGIGLGFLFALALPPALGIAARWGVAGLALAASLSAWTEFALLRRALHLRIGSAAIPGRSLAVLWGAAVAAAGAAQLIRFALPRAHPIPLAIAVLGAFGLVYGALSLLLRDPEASSAIRRMRRR